MWEISLSAREIRKINSSVTTWQLLFKEEQVKTKRSKAELNQLLPPAGTPSLKRGRVNINKYCSSWGEELPEGVRSRNRIQRKLRVSECREKVYFYYAEREQLGRSQQSTENREQISFSFLLFAFSFLLCSFSFLLFAFSFNPTSWAWTLAALAVKAQVNLAFARLAQAFSFLLSSFFSFTWTPALRRSWCHGV